MIPLLLLLLLPLKTSVALMSPETADGKLHLRVEHIKQAEGWIWVGVYNSEENFLIKEKAIIEGREVVTSGAMNIVVDHVKFGHCAVAVFHDINGNGEMDRNWIGIPVEPYAFSRKPPSRWRLPRFHEVEFYFNARYPTLSMTLKRW